MDTKVRCLIKKLDLYDNINASRNGTKISVLVMNSSKSGCKAATHAQCVQTLLISRGSKISPQRNCETHD